MIQQELFDAGVSVCSLFVGTPFEMRSIADRNRAAQLALLTVLLKSRSGQATTDDIVRDRNRRHDGDGKWLGPKISELSRDGLIRQCGAKRSDRKTRKGGSVWTWEIVDRQAVILKVKRLRRSLSFHQKTDSTAATAESASKTSTTKQGETSNGKTV